MALSEDIRRVVTALIDDGRAGGLFDGAKPHKGVRPVRKTVSRRIWVTSETPADIGGNKDRGEVEIGISPPQGGSVFRIIDIPPTPPEVAALPADAHHKEQGADAPKRGWLPRHPQMHRTRTVDYALILEGEIDMLLDDSEVHFKKGDVLIQQGTNHAWVNRGTEPCRIAFILIDSQEP
jgi:mannose-6-phosphate isomerase-like protein (cupin superfamily)